MKKFIVLAVALILTAGLFAGCAGNKPSRPSVGDAEKIKIGIAFPSKDYREWNEAGNQIKSELAALGYDVVLDYASNDIATQVTQIEELLDSGCKCLLIGAIDGDAVGAVLDEAKEKGVPVIAYDRLIMNTDAVSYYVAFDNYQIGTKQGEYIRDTLHLDTTDGPYNIEIFTGDPGDNNARFIFSGAMDVLNPYIDQGKLIVRSGQTDFKQAATAAWAVEAAMARMDALIFLNYRGEKLNAVLCSGDSLSRGVIYALEDNYDGAWPVIVGSGCEKENVKLILKDRQSMSVFRDTRKLASAAVNMLDALAKGAAVPVNDRESYDNNVKVVPSFLCEPTVVNKENYREVLIESGYYDEDELK